MALAAKIKLPPDTYVVFTGAAQGQAQAQQDLTLKSVFAGVGIVLLLSIVTRNWRNLLVTLANLPFALVGGVVAVVFIRRGSFSRLARRLRHALRHHAAQFDDDDLAL